MMPRCENIVLVSDLPLLPGSVQCSGSGARMRRRLQSLARNCAMLPCVCSLKAETDAIAEPGTYIYMCVVSKIPRALQQYSAAHMLTVALSEVRVLVPAQRAVQPERTSADGRRARCGAMVYVPGWRCAPRVAGSSAARCSPQVPRQPAPDI